MGLGGRTARFAIRRRHLVLAVSLALSAASVVSLRTLRPDVDLLDTLPAGAPAFDEYRDYLTSFGATQALPILVTGVDPAVLPRAVDALAERYRGLAMVESVLAGIERDATAPYLDPVHAPALVPADRFPELAARLTPAGIAEALGRVKALLRLPGTGALRTQLQRDPLGLTMVAGLAIRDRYADPVAAAADRHILSADRGAALILLRPRGSPFDAEFTARLFAALTAVESATRAADPAFARLELQHGGAFAHAAEDATVIRGDVIRYVGLALVGVIAIFQVGYRNVGILPLLGYLLVAGSLLAFAMSVLLYHQLNALSLSFAAVFYGLAIDAGIYFYARLLEERRDAPLEEAIVRTCDGIGAPNVVAATTTAAAFAVIAFSAIGALRPIGVLTALGMLVNVAHTFLLLPALTATFPGRLRSAPPPPRPVRALGVIAAFSARHAVVVVAVAALIVLAWAVAPSVPVDADVLHLRPRDSTATRAEDALAQAFGALALDAAAIVRGTDLEDALVREERVSTWLDAHRNAAAPPAIAGQQALSTMLPCARTERARRAAFAALPLDSARRTLHDELQRQGFRADAFADADHALAAAATAALPRDLGAAWIAPLAARHLHHGPDGVELAVFFSVTPGTSVALVRDRLRAEVAPDVVVTGGALMQAALAAVIAREVLLFTLATLALNVGIVLLQLRALGLALAVMAPTMVIVAALLVGMHAGGVPFTPINLIVLPLALGIGVDNCVYLTQRWREGHDIASAAERIGLAILLTTLTTMTGFGFLAVSRYPGLAGLGWLAALTMALTFVAAIVLLPAFLALWSRATTSPVARGLRAP